MNRRIVMFLAPVLAPLGAVLVGAAAAPPPADVVAQRGDIKVTASDVRALLEKADPAARARIEANPAALAAFVRQQIVDNALLAEAKAKGWDQRPDVMQRIKDARNAVILRSYEVSLVPPAPGFPSEATIRQTYDANIAKFTIPRQYHLTQIIVPVPQGAKPEVEEAARKKAAELRARALKPKADFAALVRKSSQDPKAAGDGGDAGWVREDRLLPPIREAVAHLREGGVSEVVHLPDGYHVLKLLGTKPPAPAPLEDVKPQIVQALDQARTQRGVRTYVAGMLKAEPIELNEIDLARQVKGAP